MKLKTTIEKQVEELTTPFQPHLLKPNAEADITFSSSLDVTVQCQQYGKIFSLGSLDPSRCHATGKGLAVAMVGEKSSALLRVVNYNDAPCEEPLQ